MYGLLLFSGIRFDVRPKGFCGQETMTPYSLIKQHDSIKIQVRYFTPKIEEHEVQYGGFQDEKIKCTELRHEEPENQEVEYEEPEITMLIEKREVSNVTFKKSPSNLIRSQTQQK